MRLNKISFRDKAIFSKYLGFTHHELSAYAFTNIYIWEKLFEIKWAILEDSLWIFFKDKLGCFLYLPPLGKHKNPAVLKKAFAMMDSFNQNKDISRIENAEEKDLEFYQNLGYECKEKFGDYLCLRTDLVELKGNKFKSKRAGFNYFIKHYKFEYLPFELRYRDECLRLYNRWMRQRKAQNPDAVYQGMLKDSGICLKVLLDAYKNLDMIGRIARVDKEVKGLTFGFKLNPDTFCILYEITDLSVKGLSQFIFRQFCGELAEYKYINIMDDSGLDNLKKVKLSYRPIRLIRSYIVKR